MCFSGKQCPLLRPFDKKKKKKKKKWAKKKAFFKIKKKKVKKIVRKKGKGEKKNKWVGGFHPPQLHFRFCLAHLSPECLYSREKK